MLFECHITVLVEDSTKAQTVADELGWKTSQIERDPLLGKDSYFYLTKHGEDYIAVWFAMQLCSKNLENSNIKVIREKIELIMYDTKRK